MNTQKLGAEKLYEDAALLHLVHAGRFVAWDRLD
jgi:hypothetical protein